MKDLGKSLRTFVLGTGSAFLFLQSVLLISCFSNFSPATGPLSSTLENVQCLFFAFEAGREQKLEFPSPERGVKDTIAQISHLASSLFGSVTPESSAFPGDFHSTSPRA